MMRDEDFSNRLNNSATFLGFTALHYAVLVDDLEVVKVLLENGANPCTENDAGHRAELYANDEDIKNLLQEHVKKVSIVIT